MKVLMINGSPHKEGNTATALQEMKKVFEQEGVEAEIVNIGNDSVYFINCFIQIKIHHISYRNWIGTFNTFHSEFTFDTTIVKFIFGRFYVIPTSGRFINSSCHF